MASAVGRRDDFDGAVLRSLARLSGHANQVRRLLALAVIYDGGARHEAARVGGVGLQTVRDWVLRFNAQGPDGLLDGKAPGPRPVLGPDAFGSQQIAQRLYVDRRCNGFGLRVRSENTGGAFQ